jgi:hypothetical protein
VVLVSILTRKKPGSMIKNYPAAEIRFDKKKLSKQLLLASILTLLIVSIITLLAKFSPPSSFNSVSGAGPSGINRNADANSIAEFRDWLEASYPEQYKATGDGLVSLSFRKNSVYRLDAKTSYQAIITPNSLIKKIILHQLDNLGVAYEISESAVAGKASWMISWGGILYFPEI